MKNLILIISIFSLLSCKNDSDKFQTTVLDSFEIKIPYSFTKKADDNCKNINLFTDSINNSRLEFKLCNYGLKTGRQSYENLNRFFKEECEVLKEEIPESISIKTTSKNNGDYFFFTYDYKIGEKYYSNNYISYKKYYLTIRFQSTNKKTITELKHTIDELCRQDLSDRIKLTDSDNVCYYCKSPLFW